MSHLEHNCEGIDAAVFSGDMLFSDEKRAMLKDYVGRWTRAIDDHEKTEAAEQQVGQRQDFEMTQAQLDRLLDACKPVPYMVFGGVPPRSPQENANAAWAVLGDELGFEAMSVEPSSKGNRFFTALLKANGETK